MQSLRVLSPDLKLLAEIDDYEYLQFTRKYYGIGNFELRINSNKNHVETLQKNNLVMLGNNPDKVGIILYKEIGMNDAGKQSEQWIIKGCTLNGIVSQRITVPPVGSTNDAIKGNAETVMKHYINTQIVNPKLSERQIDLVEIAEDKQLGEHISFQSRYKNLGEELEKISSTSNVGWKMAIDSLNRKWVFDCYVGSDRTTLQSVNPPIIFSTAFETLKEAQFIDSSMNYKNYVYVGGQGEGVDRTILEVGTGSGLERYEVFADARDSDEGDILVNRGNEILAENAHEISFEGAAITNGVYVFEKDWFLGDLVTISHAGWGVTIHTRVTEVSEIFEPSGYRLETVFGKATPTLTSKIKQELRQFSAEVLK